MSAIVIGAETWSRVDRCTLSRRELVRDIVENAVVLFPGLLVLPVELVKHYENDEFATDLVIVDESSARWWVGHIATSIEDFERDLLLPARWVQRVKYTPEDFDAIVGAASEVDTCVGLETLLASAPPASVAFVSNPHPTWFGAFADEDAHLAVLEIFVNPGKTRLLRLNGMVPQALGTQVGHCTFLPGGQNLLKLTPIAGLGVPSEMQIEWLGDVMTWSAEDLGDFALLATSRPPDTFGAEALELWHLGLEHFVLRSGQVSA